MCWGGSITCDTVGCPSGPVPITGLAGPATSVAVGGAVGCAITTGGNVQCWGDRLDDAGHSISSAIAEPVPGLGSGIVSISVGVNSACAVKAGGAAVCWGGNA